MAQAVVLVELLARQSTSMNEAFCARLVPARDSWYGLEPQLQHPLWHFMEQSMHTSVQVPYTVLGTLGLRLVWAMMTHLLVSAPLQTAHNITEGEPGRRTRGL